MHIQAGKTELLAPLWGETRRLILHIARRYAPDMRRRGNWIDWEDIEQNGFLALVAAVRAYNPSKGWAFNSYLNYQIQLIMTRCSSREPPYTISLDEPIAGEDDDLSLADLIPDPQAQQDFEKLQIQIYTQELIHSLPPEQAQILWLRYGKGYTLESISQAMGISREKVRRSEAAALYSLRYNSET